MGFIEFMGNALKANKAIDHAATQKIIEEVGTKGIAAGEKLGGKLGAVKEYNESLRGLTGHATSGASIDEIEKSASMVKESGETLRDRAGGKNVSEAVNRTFGKDNGGVLNKMIDEGKYDAVSENVDKQAQYYIDAYNKTPEKMKESFQRLQGVNEASGKGTANSVLDTAKSYLSGADIRAGYKTGDYSMGEAVGLGAVRGAAVIGGTATVVGGTRAVGRAIFGGGSEKGGGGYSY